MMKIVQGDQSWELACRQIGVKLPTFFNPDGLAQMEQDLANHQLYVALEDETLLGFLTIHRESMEVAEISWMAVEPEEQGQGIGQKLISFVAQTLEVQGVKLLKVKTLSEREEYPPYEKTRAFYRRCGFILFETIDPYEPWGPGNPCAIYVKILTEST